jgi:hypothetical protein
MTGKKLLAGIFAGLILVKLVVILINPGAWVGLTQVVLDHYGVMMVFYLALLVLTGYYVFSRVDLMDVAVVMLFTSILLGLTLFPYLAVLPRFPESIIALGLGRAWVAMLIWIGIAVAVLYRIFSGRKG